MIKKQIKMPKGIKTLEEFFKWQHDNFYVQSRDGYSNDKKVPHLKIYMKKKSYYPFDFTEEDMSQVNGYIRYLISDGSREGRAKVENFNRSFRFYSIQY
jgi:hypothetical protein